MRPVGGKASSIYKHSAGICASLGPICPQSYPSPTLLCVTWTTFPRLPCCLQVGLANESPWRRSEDGRKGKVRAFLPSSLLQAASLEGVASPPQLQHGLGRPALAPAPTSGSRLLDSIDTHSVPLVVATAAASCGVNLIPSPPPV